jgi:hypothetical protein
LVENGAPKDAPYSAERIAGVLHALNAQAIDRIDISHRRPIGLDRLGQTVAGVMGKSGAFAAKAPRGDGPPKGRQLWRYRMCSRHVHHPHSIRSCATGKTAICMAFDGVFAI